MTQPDTGGKRRAKYDVQLDRREAKYVIAPSLVHEIREFVRPFCEPDPNGRGTPPEYTITTLQLDTPDLALHRAKLNEAVSRFKLRVRTYGEPGENPVYLEVKRKIGGTIVKSRTSVPFDLYGERLVRDPRALGLLRFRSEGEEIGFIEFVRLAREIGAEPAILVRYIRESYFGKSEQYARVTFDRNLCYQRTRSWNSWGQGCRWIPMDSTLAQDKGLPVSGVILELKTLSDAPRWMIDLVMRFDLVTVGNCKYSTAVMREAAFYGMQELLPLDRGVICG